MRSGIYACFLTAGYPAPTVTAGACYIISQTDGWRGIFISALRGTGVLREEPGFSGCSRKDY